MGRSQPQRDKQRRALTGAKGGGRTASGGDRRYARGLLDALTAPGHDKNDEVASSLTHAFHAYPARMHPATARAIIEGVAPHSVLDPFCGSGTTLVEALAHRCESTGVDANPLAIRLSATKTWRPGRKLIKELSVSGRQIADAAIEEVKAARRSRDGQSSEEKRKKPRARPALRGQFPPHVLAELETLLAMIRADASEEVVPHLEMVLSSVLYKVSLRTSDSDATLTRRQIPRAAASRHFRQRVIELADALRATDRAGGPQPTLIHGDARELDVAPGAIDFVISSPPYPGTYNYVEHHQLRMDFLGIDSRTFSKQELGARRLFRGDSRNVGRSLDRWRKDTTEILTRLRRALRKDGLICLLVGDSLASQTAVRANHEMPKLAEAAGLRTVAWAWQTRRPFGSREKQAFASDPKREHLVLYAVT